MRRLDFYWQDNNLISLLLLPLSWLFCFLVWLRRLAYRRGWLRTTHLPVPVWVVGNITVGGSGKTPLVIWLAQWLQQKGYRPGIISRGYGGMASTWPQVVSADSDPHLVGDEPVLIARRTGCPMVVAPDRVAAARALLAQSDIDIIISDDGMQHYRLGRDIEVEVSDAKRGYGNGRCLPAGPLREPPSRLNGNVIRVSNGASLHHADVFTMTLNANTAWNLQTGKRTSLSEFHGQRVHAVAGIGNPVRFFDTLRSAGIEPIEHSMPDHHAYKSEDLRFSEKLPLLMTEKDAVKCMGFASGSMWAVAVDADLPESFILALVQRLNKG